MAQGSSITKETFEDILDRKLEENLKPICESMNELKECMKFLSDKYDSIDKRTGELESKYQQVIQDNKFLVAEVTRLSRSLNDTATEINDMNQYSRRECCEITGLPVEPSENTNNLVIKVGSLMGVALNESDISVSHRLPINKTYASRTRDGVGNQADPTSQFPKVIVKFVRRETKELFYKNRKHLREMSTRDIGLSRISENKIFISESLSPRNKVLFKDCLKFKFNYGFKFIWTQQGRIYLRKNNDTPARVITGKVDLEKLSPSR